MNRTPSFGQVVTFRCKLCDLLSTKRWCPAHWQADLALVFRPSPTRLDYYNDLTALSRLLLGHAGAAPAHA